MNSSSKKADSNSVPYLWLHLPWKRKLKGVNKWIAKLCLTTEKRASPQAPSTVHWQELHRGLCLLINTQPFL